MIQSNLYLENRNLTEIETNDFISDHGELSFVEQSQENETCCEKVVVQSYSDMFLENDKQTEMLSDKLSSTYNFAQLTLTEPLQSKASFCGGLLLVWGCGEFGQHGHGHTKDVPRVDALGSPLWLGQDRMVIEVACGSSHTMVLTDDNKVYNWGNSNSGQLGMGDTETSPHPHPLHLGVSLGAKLSGITCGTRHSFVWTQDGDCFSFGNNYSGQLGYDFRKPDFKENQLRPVFVDTLLRRAVSQVACGARHSVFLFTNGQVAAVGVNSRGQIGCGDTVDVVCAKTISEIPPVSMIACGNSHTLAADVHGCVYAWGYGKACGSKTDILSPLCVYSGSKQDKIVDMAGGDSHSLILLSCGAVYSWGNNFEGQLGLGRSVKFVSEPKELSFNLLPGKVVSLSVGENTCAAVTDDGMLYMWGKNSNLVIRGDENSRFFQFEPYLVSLGVWRALKVSCGSWHVACVVFPATKGEKNYICQEISETTTVKADDVCSNDIHRNEQIVEATMVEGNQYCKAVSHELPDEKGSTPSITNRDKEQLLTNNLIICDGSEAKLDELFESTNTRELKHSEKQNRKQDDGLANKTDVHDRTEANVYSVNDGPVMDNSLEEKPALMDKSLEEKPALMDNSLEEKPALMDNSLDEKSALMDNSLDEKSALMASVHPTPCAEIREEKHGVIFSKLKNPGDNTEKPGVIVKHPCDRTEKHGVIVNMFKNPVDSKESNGNSERHNANPAMVAESRDHDGSNTFVQEFTLMRTVKKERKHKTLIPTCMELKQPANERTLKEAESDKCDALIMALSSKAESTCEEENKVDVEHEANVGLVTRTRAFSEQTSNAGSAQDISVALHSGSLDNLRLYHQQESAIRALKPSRVTYSPATDPRSSVGHLTREKRPPRMLRRESFDVEYHLPNQPLHTVDIGLSPSVLRPHPPMNRTQSSPSLYSSNLIRSPLGARKKSCVSAKVPRTTTVATTCDGGLPPRPPARGNRRPLEFNPMFSSGTSWRKR